MCRNIRTLHNFEPPATTEEIHAAALQFVRKVSGMNKPSKTNADAFAQATAQIEATVQELLTALQTSAPAKNRDIEAEKAKTRARLRFGSQGNTN